MSAGSALARKGHSPLLLILLGLVCLFFWILGTSFEIQTSEAFIIALSIAKFAFGWTVFMQPIDFVHGNLAIVTAWAMFWGFGTEVIYLVCVIGFTIVHDVMKRSHDRVASLFGTVAIGIIALNAWSNFQYAAVLPSGFWGQVAASLVVAFITAFFGVAGARLIEVAVTSMRA